jgi:endonuclease YncB( thermonuclease family)
MRQFLVLAALPVAVFAAGSGAFPVAVAPAAAQQIADAPALPTVAVQPHAIHPVPDQGEPTAPPPAAFSPAAPPPRVTPHTRDTRAPLPALLRGMALPISATTLSVLGRPVRLFGVEPAAAQDRCPLPAGPAQPCDEVARNVLTGRLLTAPAVTCHAPPGQRGVPGFICHDAAGIDLGELLVTNGLALADTHQSYQYFDAEASARKARRGLWRYR